MNVTLLAHTPCAEELIYTAMRQCYSDKDAQDLFASAVAGSVEMRKLILDVVASGHDSPLEHVTFTFAITGVSRSLTHQLVRHRVASYSQQSQRYVKAEGFEYIVPESVKLLYATNRDFHDAMEAAQVAYDRLVAAGIPAEDARYVLPNAAVTKIVTTMNCRALLNFFSHRCCKRAQWEIRGLADRMLAHCRVALPVVFSGAGPDCRSLGYCPEGEKFTCGKYPVRITETK